jgi:hypothetical protein
VSVLRRLAERSKRVWTAVALVTAMMKPTLTVEAVPSEYSPYLSHTQSRLHFCLIL